MARRILFITTDQQRYDALGCNGGQVARTPVIDRLAAEGVRYERAHPQNVVCMPSRATIVTGQHVRNHGVWMNGVPMAPDAPTVAKVLLDAGWRTALFGKAHFEPFLDPFLRFPENRMGVTRASYGVQDCDPDVQKAIHRIQPHEMNVETMQNLRDCGYDSVNMDLIYGLPLQTPESFSRTLDLVLELKPDRFAIFNYAHVPGMRPAQKLLERHGLPSAETKLELLQLCIERLTDAGYVYIGMDHFALPTDELVKAQRDQSLQRNFQGYSTRAGVEICGFGISSISQGANGFRQNNKDLLSYTASIEAGKLPITKGYEQTDEDKMRSDIIMRLMCDLSLDFGAMSEKWQIDFREHFADAIQQLEEPLSDELITWTDKGFAVTERGRLFVRNLAMCFDAYLEPTGTGRYSKTI